ncbi:KpsF/GutQ family sugar-phosphate isomerase [Rhodobaculum claviforme]|uniref:KpsF/GutQ family sugar-phosphate isomerase n=1 Tax=Rhodobaculum claviforme TaxID=1549854 RepID=UPI003B84ACB2
MPQGLTQAEGPVPDLDSVRVGQGVLRAEVQGLSLIDAALSEGLAAPFARAFARAVDAIRTARGRLIVSGMGKSGHVGRKIAATFASTGTPAQFVHPAEASHGDLGMITSADICLLLSASGETKELADVIAHARRHAIALIGISRVADSTLMRQSDPGLLLPDAPEACAIGLAPTTSTTMMMALGDALAVAVMQARGFSREGFAAFHPGGTLGAQLAPVRALMHDGDALPVVTPDTPMGEALIEMSRKGFGVVAVVAGDRLAGVVTDGDLRRNLDGLMARTAGAVATPNPQTIGPDALASEALGIMTARRITSLMVVDGGGTLLGLIHLHDCLRAGVA